MFLKDFINFWFIYLIAIQEILINTTLYISVEFKIKKKIRKKQSYSKVKVPN